MRSRCRRRCKGSREIAFTIVSISISLIAVLIPLLLMGGIIGRLFREFAVTLSMAIVVSAFVVADADADDGVALPAGRRSEAHHGRLYAMSERGFDALLHAYERGLDVVLRHQLHHAAACSSPRSRSVGLSVHDHPQGLFPAAGHRPDHRHFRSRAGRLASPNDEAPAGSSGEIVRQRSRRRPRRDVDRRAAAIALNTGRMFITLKPRNERDSNRRSGHRAAARRKLDKVEGARLFLQAAQDVRVGGRASRTQFQYTLQDADIERAQRMGAEDAGEAARRCRNCATSPPISRPKARR